MYEYLTEEHCFEEEYESQIDIYCIEEGELELQDVLPIWNNINGRGSLIESSIKDIEKTIKEKLQMILDDQGEVDELL